MPINGKWEYLKYDTLKGCLAQISNQGTLSFQCADAEMESIATDCDGVTGAVNIEVHDEVGHYADSALRSNES
jgi:hypothetical protein